MEQGEYVLIEAPDFFKGKKLAWYVEECKDHEGGHICHIINKNEQITTKKICVQPARKGNSIVSLSSVLEGH
jgi:hypothetical protein